MFFKISSLINCKQITTRIVFWLIIWGIKTTKKNHLWTQVSIEQLKCIISECDIFIIFFSVRKSNNNNNINWCLTFTKNFNVLQWDCFYIPKNLVISHFRIFFSLCWTTLCSRYLFILKKCLFLLEKKSNFS
jgi:hypothetical protein